MQSHMILFGYAMSPPGEHKPKVRPEPQFASTGTHAMPLQPPHRDKPNGTSPGRTLRP